MSLLQDTLANLYHWYKQDEFVYGTEDPEIFQRAIDINERFIDRDNNERIQSRTQDPPGEDSSLGSDRSAEQLSSGAEINYQHTHAAT